jgi:rfaE bifunctional protein nucleotidyltransferase chain/domain
LSKILNLQALLSKRKQWKSSGKKVVFTNGCFDLLHRGHIHLFREAKELGDILVVALNDDASVRRIKGSSRPIFPLQERLEILEAVTSIDALISFPESNPRNIIAAVLPDVLVKGGDWKLDEVVGRDEVEQAGGKTVVIPYLAHQSSSEIIERIVRRQASENNPD